MYHEDNLSVTAALPPFHASLARSARAIQPLTQRFHWIHHTNDSLHNLAKKYCKNAI